MTNPLAQDLGGVVLLPCPFCGSENAEVQKRLWWVQCNECDANGPAKATEAESIAAWNTRAHSAEIAGALRDAGRMEWLTSMAVEVRTPLRYGSAALFHARPDNDEGEPYHTTLRAQIDSAMQQGGGAG